MARYPTFEEYQKSGKFKDGIKRCGDLLKKHPQDVTLLTTQLQLCAADKQNIRPILDKLLEVQPPIQDLGELYAINNAVVASQQNVWPRPHTIGPEVAKLWENAVKASTLDNKLELLVQRFESSVEADYMIDAQQALIQLKALQPKHRAIYMAHAAVTQLISMSKEDMQSRLALMLAKKAVTEKFDDEKDLDCRVPGQIFALQGSTKDLDSIQGRRFGESKQVFEALRETNGSASNTEPEDPVKTSPADWLSAEVAMLKARFTQLMDVSTKLDALLTFAANAIRLFHTTLASMPAVRSRSKAEPCFLAISALVKAFTVSQQHRHLLIGVFLAETLLDLDSHIHEARLILVYLYVRLGLGSLAIKYFDSLSIKEVQFDTVGHALFTGLSYVYPHQLPTGKKEERNPMSRAKNAVQVYRRCEEKLAETEASVLRNGQTGMIFDIHELRDSLRSSATKRIIFLEIRRQARLMLGESSWHTSDLGPKGVANWIETTDNRDLAATFDYGLNVEKALYSHDGHLPGREWILYGLAADVAWCLASGKESDSPVDDSHTLLDAFEDDTLDIGKLSLDGGESKQLAMSESEHVAGELARQVLRLVLLVKGKPTQDEVQSSVEAAERGVGRLNVTALCETKNASAEMLREHFTYLDVLKVAEKGCMFALASESGKTCTGSLKRIQQIVQQNIAALRKHAEEQRKGITSAGIKAEIDKSGEEVYAAVKSLGEDALRRFCDAVAESAKEGWVGIGKVKV